MRTSGGARPAAVMKGDLSWTGMVKWICMVQELDCG